MGIIEIALIGIGLAMDAFAVSIGKGLSVPKTTVKHVALVALWFGGFQALMPLLGWLLGSAFAGLISSIDHWIAFVLLALIGGNMLREALGGDDDEDEDEDGEKAADFGPKTMLMLAVATSIDALAVGVNFGIMGTNIWLAITIIGVLTAIISAVGLKIGNFVGEKFKTKAEIFGGIVLIGIGIKILVEHLFF